jgi:hypothetical protein
VRKWPATFLLFASLTVCESGCSDAETVPVSTRNSRPLKSIQFHVLSGAPPSYSRLNYQPNFYSFKINADGHGVYRKSFDTNDDQSFTISPNTFAEFEKLLAPYRDGGEFESMSPGCGTALVHSYLIRVRWIDINDVETVLSQDMGCNSRDSYVRQLKLITAHKLMPLEKKIGFPIDEYLRPSPLFQP